MRRQITTLAPPETEYLVELHALADGVEFSLTIRHFDWDGLPLSICLLDQERNIVSSTECDLEQDGEDWVGGGIVTDVNSNTDYTFAIMADEETILFSRPIATAVAAYVEVIPTRNGLSYDLGVENYSVADQLILRITHEAKEWVFAVECNEQGGSITASGSISDLDSSTTYQIALLDGGAVLYTSEFVTLDAMGIALSFVPQQVEALYYLSIDEYEVLDTLILHVYDESTEYDNMMPIEYIENAGIESEGAVSGLEPSTTYVVQLLDGETVLYETTFTTRRAVSVDFNVFPEAHGFSYSISVYDYALQGSLVLRVRTSDDEVDYLYAIEYGQDEGDIFAEGTIEGLDPLTTYYVSLLDDDFLLYGEDEMRTESAILVAVTPFADAVDYEIRLGDYEVAKELTVRVDQGETMGTPITVYIYNEGEGLMGMGSVYDLSSHTAYTFLVLDGDDILYEQAFTTPYDVNFEGSADGRNIYYGLVIRDYEIESAIAFVIVTGEDSTWTVYPEVDVTSDGIFADGTLELDYGRWYDMSIVDGETVLYETKVMTQVEASVSFGSGVTSISFDIDIQNYQPMGTITAHIIGDTEQYVDLALDDMGGYLTAHEILIDGLTPNNVYTFILEDEGIEIYNTVFETSEYLDVDITPYSTSVFVSITVNDAYTPNQPSFDMVIEDVDGETVAANACELTVDEGVTMGNTEIESLYPNTYYTLVIYDGETELYRGTFSTTEA
ncbi:MAG: hypothetical protein J5755_04185, partial [Clostridia bacterium]|nr:hypothetical protein [Clostridia bacterium]